MMTILRALTLLVVLSLPAVVEAQSDSFTAEDDALMQQCFAQVADAAEVDAGGGASLSDCIGAASNVCKQADFSAEAAAICNAREQAWWDALLTRYYTTLSTGLPAPTAQSLRKAQDAWLDYRDARCDYGEILWGTDGDLPITSTFCWLMLTAERVIDLSYDLSAVEQ
jgi:uncharacterized protein YecT (DUF1311 family)